MAFQLNGASQESLASGNDNLAAAFLRTLVDGFLDGLLVLGCRCIGTGAKCRNQIVLAGNLRLLDALFYLSIRRLVPSLGMA